MKKARSHNIFLLLLIVTSILICYKNYTPNTILSGWDTINPEYNIGQYWTRITSVFQEHQGLGAPPSQAHAAEIPRMVIYSLLALILPLNLVRYVFVFLMIVIGPLGVYLFLDYILNKNQDEQQQNHIAPFLGALFYLLNLGTMQHFVVVLEMFAVKFGFLGFIYLFATKFIDYGKKKDLMWFVLMIILSSAMAHTATLWYVFFIGIVIYSLFLSYFSQNKAMHFKRSVVLAVLMVFLNLYWILPNLYYSVNYSADLFNSKINRLSSNELYLHNKNYGTIPDLLILRNFLFDWDISQTKDVYKNDSLITSSVKLLENWENHIKNPIVLSLIYLIFVSSYAGLAYALKKKNLPVIGLLPIIGISVFFLLPNTYPISGITEFIRNRNISLHEVLRFPFTKFSLYLIFGLSVGFSFFNRFILSKIHKQQAQFIYPIAVVLVILCVNYPAFTGNFVSPALRVKIPGEYQQLFNWSQKQDKGRMLMLPLHSLYGWNIFGWGTPPNTEVYQGAGFAWFGLKQPLLNREFDRWYPYNEQAYRELTLALYTNDFVLFQQLLSKYNIKYLLFDKNIINPGGFVDEQKLAYLQIEEMIPNIEGLRLTREFSKKLKVYEFGGVRNQVAILENTVSVGPLERASYLDQAYLDNGSYFSNNSELSSQNDLYYPFRNILNQRENIDKNVFQIQDNFISIQVDEKAISGKNVSGFNSTGTGIEKIVKDSSDLIFTDNRIKKIYEFNSTTLSPQVNACQPEKYNNNSKKITEEYVEYTSKDSAICEIIPLTNIEIGRGYVVEVESQYISGLPIKLCLEEVATGKCVIDDILPKTSEWLSLSFLALPYNYKDRHNLIIRNMAVGSVKTQNRIKNIKIFSIPYLEYATLKWQSKLLSNISVHETPLTYEELSPSIYTAIINNTVQINSIIALDLAYEKNWKAYKVTDFGFINTYLPFVFGHELPEHVMVNNWANGWKIDSNQSGKIVIIFTPQYLQYFGYVVFGLTILFFLIRNRLFVHDNIKFGR